MWSFGGQNSRLLSDELLGEMKLVSEVSLGRLLSVFYDNAGVIHNVALRFNKILTGLIHSVTIKERSRKYRRRISLHFDIRSRFSLQVFLIKAL